MKDIIDFHNKLISGVNKHLPEKFKFKSILKEVIKKPIRYQEYPFGTNIFFEEKNKT